MRALIGLAFLPFALSAVEPAMFFEQSCVQCHGPKKQKAKLRLDILAWTPDDSKNLETWRKRRGQDEAKGRLYESSTIMLRKVMRGGKSTSRPCSKARDTSSDQNLDEG